MEWFNFNNIQFKSFFIITLVLVFFTIGLLVTFFLSTNKDKGYDNRIQAEATTLRIYIIDPKNNSVVYFNRSDLRNKKKIDMKELEKYGKIVEVKQKNILMNINKKKNL